MSNEPRPINDQIVVKQDPPIERSQGGIILTRSFEDWPPTGTIVRMGPGKPRADGTREPFDEALSVGVRVHFKRRASTALIPDPRETSMCPPEHKDVLMLVPDDIMLVLGDDA
jgi:co-chaperonin GroES (HSP10)